MELVYLWVEEYKNIHKQGFNFSPRFHCDYNYKTKELTIEENNDYIPDFFGKNINVTAIVGKNGSGKSRILELIQLIIYKKNTRKNFLLIKKNKKLYCSSSTIIIFKKKFLVKFNKLPMLKSPFFDYSISYTYSFIDKHNKEFMRYPNKDKGILNFKNEVYQGQKNIIDNYLNLKKQNQLDKFKSFFQPYKFSISLNRFPTKRMDYSIPKEKMYIAKEIRKETGFKVLEQFNEILNLLYSGIDKKLKNTQLEGRYEDEYEEMMDSYQEIGHLFMELEILEKEKIKNLPNLKKIFEKNLISTPMDNKFCEFLIDELEIEEVEELMKIVDDEYFSIDLIGVNTKKLSDLSFGEQQLIKILNQLYSFKKDDIENYIVLLDEIDIGFHPDWQKRTVKYIIDFLSLISDKNFHLIFSTHSPFLLSDIPKKNIIFLNNKPSMKQTFGANIHTLLSDSFFMENGLMGEFAKSKIMQIQKFHKKVLKYQENEKVKKAYICFYNKKQKEFEQIQSIIGEPFLKTIVKNQLEEIETILFKDKAKQLAIQRFINEFGKDAIISEVMSDDKD